MEYFIGLDLGSTATKGVIISGEGEILKTAEERIRRVYCGDEATFEIDPEGYIDSVFRIVAGLSVGRNEVTAISWVAASGNILLVDERNRPCANMISWLDTRPLDGSIESSIAGLPVERIHDMVGWPFSRQFPLGRLLWLRENRPELMGRARRICTGNDYLGFRLCGTWAMDHSTATTMYLYEQAAGRKNEALIERLGLKPPMISDLLPTGSLLGRISPEARARTGLNEGTQAFLGCFDHPGAARALEIRGRRQLLMSCGTSWVGLVVLGDRGEGIARGMLVDPYESASGGGWCGMFSLAGMGKRFDSWIVEAFRQGAALRELDSACPAPSMEEFLRTMNRVAAAVDPLGRIPAIDLKTMKPDPETVESLLRTHSAGELFRALMESAAFEFRSLLLDKGIGLDAIDEVFLVGGPSGSIVWRQIIADTLAKPLTVRYGKTAGAAGAARIAAKASGFPLGTREPEAKIDPCPRAVDAVDARYRRFRERRDEGR